MASEYSSANGTATLDLPSPRADYGRRLRFVRLAILVYAVVSLTWIFLSDRLIEAIVEPETLARISSLKGGIFVLVTSVLLYFVLLAVPAGSRQDERQGLIECLSTTTGRRPAWIFYLLAGGLAAATLLLRLWLRPFVGDHPLTIMLLPPIILGALLGGLGPGLLATVIATAGLALLILPPSAPLHPGHIHNLLHLGLLLGCGLLVSILAEALHRERWRAEARRQLFDAIIAGSQDAIYMKDNSGRYVLCNEAAARFMDRRPQDVLGRDDTRLFPPETAERIQTWDRVVLAGAHPRISEEQVKTPRGEDLVFLTHKVPLFDHAGQVAGLFGIAREITERKRTEERLRESEARYRELFTNMSEGFALGEPLFDPDGRAVDFRLLDVNEAFERQTGLPRDEVLGSPASSYLSGVQPEWIERFARVAASGRAERFEVRGPTSGRYFDVYAYRPKPGHFATLFADITERTSALEAARRLNNELEERVRERTAELIQVNQALVESNIELRHFAHVAAHDLQTPLRSIVGFAQLLERDLGEARPPVSDWLAQIIGNTRRLQGLIRELLDYTGLEHRSSPFTPIDMQAVLDEIRSNLAPLVAERQAVIEAAPLPTLRADRKQLALLLQHLVENGIKYNRSRPPRVEVGCERRDGEWMFAVADNGIGIDARHQQAIFEPFRRLHTYDEIPGSGIGLAVCRRIVHAHGGHLWVESRPGEGSVFRFTLPAEPITPPGPDS